MQIDTGLQHYIPTDSAKLHKSAHFETSLNYTERCTLSRQNARAFIDHRPEAVFLTHLIDRFEFLCLFVFLNINK